MSGVQQVRNQTKAAAAPAKQVTPLSFGMVTKVKDGGAWASCGFCRAPQAAC